MAELKTKLVSYEIDPATYEWSVRVFRTVKKLLGVNLKLHADKDQIEQGDILVLNHFSRFETFIPQYLIYEETGLYCYAVASSEFFEGDEVLVDYLHNVGAIPHDHDSLLPLLAKQILRGRKVIIFPEGGMVKDRKVIDAFGDYNVFSRSAMSRRKHHTGAAVLALGLDLFKLAVKKAYIENDIEKLERWRADIGFNDVGELLSSSLHLTTIVPSNITFYPIRVSDNVLRKGAELLSRGLTRRHSEELLIEGNILLKDTDMDIRLGAPIYSSTNRRSWETKFLQNLDIDSIDDAFAMRDKANMLSNKLLAHWFKTSADRIRDDYMERIYASVTINLSHLASTVVVNQIGDGKDEIHKDTLHTALYLAIKHIQRIPGIHLHRSLKNPDSYRGLISGNHHRLEQFFATSESSKLVEQVDGTLRFLPKLLETQGFDEIRVENPIEVYANEVYPLASVIRAVKTAIQETDSLDPQELAALKFDDEILSLHWDKAFYSKDRFEEINSVETATESAEPFFLKPERPNGCGIVLIHGFLASPAEVRGFGERLVSEGYTVIGPRLKGHGTSPWDLRSASWENWFDSVRRAYDIIESYTERIQLVGFSTGGALALRLAADQLEKVVSLTVISVPIKFRDSRMMVIPLLHSTNTVVRWVSSFEGVKPFFQNDTEHPDINYRNIPVRGLYELRRLVKEVENRLSNIRCPTFIFQPDQDPVVAPKSASIIFDNIESREKQLFDLKSNKHGVLADDIDHTQEKILALLNLYSNSKKPVQGQSPLELFESFPKT